MSGYDYLCPEMDYFNSEDFLYEESIFVSRLPPQIFSERYHELREHLENIFKRYGEAPTFHYLPSVSKVCVVYHRPGEAALAREELDETNFQMHGSIRVESLCLVTAPWSERYLKVPKTQKQFLISPPSSPPVGWEPSEEPAPVRPEALESALLNLMCPPGELIDLFESDNPSHPIIRLDMAFVGEDQSDHSLSLAAVRTTRPNY